jgi:hypothetical protein
MSTRRSMTQKQKNELCMITQLGCDPTTARNYFSLTSQQLRNELELERDPDFAQRLAQATASAELHHMRNVHQAAKDEKNWRTSVWWLERRVPEHFGRRDPRSLSPEQWADALREMAQAILEVIDDLVVRARVIARLQQFTALSPRDNSVAQPSRGAAGGDDVPQ